MDENPYASPSADGEELSPQKAVNTPSSTTIVHWRLLPIIAVVMLSFGATIFGILLLIITIGIAAQDWGDANIYRGGESDVPLMAALAIFAGIGVSQIVSGVLGFYAAYLLSKKRWRRLAIAAGCIVLIYCVIGITFTFLRAN